MLFSFIEVMSHLQSCTVEDDGLSNSDPGTDSYSSANGDIGTQLNLDRKKMQFSIYSCFYGVFFFKGKHAHFKNEARQGIITTAVGSMLAVG